MPAFTIHAAKGGQSVTTVRIGAAVTVAKARALADAGWQVHITDADGLQHGPETWDGLLDSNPINPSDHG